MNRKHLKGALFFAAASLLATGAYADNTTGTDKPGTTGTSHGAVENKTQKVGDKVEKAGEKVGDKAEKAGDKIADKAEKAADKIDKAGEKAKTAEDRSARRAKEHDAQREKLKGSLKAPMSDAQKAELRRHAERIARLDRIRFVAETEKDKTTSERTAALISKENERHEKAMSIFSTTATTGGAK